MGISLAIRSEADGSFLSHKVTGYVSKENKTIYIYDGASYINFIEGIKSLSNFLKEKLPDYKQKAIIRGHQNKYRTCAIFQPVVGFLMALYDVPYLVLNLFDELHGEKREAIIDNITMNICKFVNSQEDAIKADNKISSPDNESNYGIKF